jgi:hypothetical protein
MTIITSFYTADWKYPEYADSLKNNCSNLNLKHHIVEKPTNNDYVKNCNIKPFFIREVLDTYKCPIFWIDVDGSINKTPELLISEDIRNYDIAVNRSVSNPSRIYVGSMWFNYNEKTVNFINEWCNALEKYGIDDGVFNGIWSNFSKNLNILELPDSYFYILPWPDSTIPEEVYIAHRLSNSDLKIKYKNECRK